MNIIMATQPASKHISMIQNLAPLLNIINTHGHKDMMIILSIHASGMHGNVLTVRNSHYVCSIVPSDSVRYASLVDQQDNCQTLC